MYMEGLVLCEELHHHMLNVKYIYIMYMEGLVLCEELHHHMLNVKYLRHVLVHLGHDVRDGTRGLFSRQHDDLGLVRECIMRSVAHVPAYMCVCVSRYMCSFPKSPIATFCPAGSSAHVSGIYMLATISTTS